MEIGKAQMTVKPLDSFKEGFSKKYRKSLKTIALLSVGECREAHPNWTLVEVLADILKTINPHMPPAFLAEFVQHIITEWENAGIEKEEQINLAA
jgi:hypothetical protein